MVFCHMNAVLSTLAIGLAGLLSLPLENLLLKNTSTVQFTSVIAELNLSLNAELFKLAPRKVADAKIGKMLPNMDSGKVLFTEYGNI